jgi:hypothetical protein
MKGAIRAMRFALASAKSASLISVVDVEKVLAGIVGLDGAESGDWFPLFDRGK